ncbi:MAG: M13-type metalloendopeptidase, partial [Spirochaetales bacterium]
EAISNLVENLIAVVPLTVMDARKGYWDDYYAAEPSLIFKDYDLNNYFLPLVQVDIFEYYSKTDEYRIWKEYLENLCNRVIYNYRRMLSETEWLTEETKARALEKIDGMGFELLIPKDRSNLLRVEYVSAEEGGTLFENLVRYLKARRSWVYNHGTDSVLDYEWSTWNCWKEYPFYSNINNTFYLTLSDFIASHITPQSSEEDVMGYLGTTIGHEISHAFDYNGSYFNTDGKVEDWWTEEDRSEFTERAYRLAEYMEDYEFLPGFSIRNGIQVVNETIADLTSMKCMMRIAAEIPDFDYEKFFYVFANSDAISSTRRGADYFLLPDEHANGRTRVNRILSATDEFYRIFDIQSGDAMYVSPEERPVVW